MKNEKLHIFLKPRKIFGVFLCQLKNNTHLCIDLHFKRRDMLANLRGHFLCQLIKYLGSDPRVER